MAASFPTVRDPVLSVFQSAAAAVDRQRPGDAGATAAAAAQIAMARRDATRAYAPPGNTTVSATTCAGLGLELLEAIIAGDTARQAALHDRMKYSSCDLLWVETLTAYAANLLPNGQPRPVPYIRYQSLADFVLPAPRPALRVALLSDWGTGTNVARQVAALLAKQQPDVAIHLGDIYYAGTAGECEAHFYAPLRAALPNQPLFTLCGNHDVYSGGQGYYALLRQIGQPASYFCLRSPDRSWQILAGDTGLNDQNPFNEADALTHLDAQEVLWHADKLRDFPGRTLLLTHHQPFSAYAQIGPADSRDPVNHRLMANYGQLAAAGRIDAWFWGHEHRLKLYAPYRGITAGRNIGYGAIPVEAVAGPEWPLPGLVDPPTAAVDITLDTVDGAYTHGFAILDCSPDGIDASYWALTHPEGPIYQERLTGAAGV